MQERTGPTRTRTPVLSPKPLHPETIWVNPEVRYRTPTSYTSINNTHKSNICIGDISHLSDGEVPPDGK